MSFSNNNSPKYIFLFILDAVRKDHLSLYGYRRKTTPAIDRLAQEADVYHWAFAPAPYTLASVPSILAGKYPIELSNLFTTTKFLKNDFEILINLREEYITSMFTANLVTSSYHTNIYQFFDYFWDKIPKDAASGKDYLHIKGTSLMKEVKSYIRKNIKNKLFITIHLMEAHGPYTNKVYPEFFKDELFLTEEREILRIVNDSFLGVTKKLVREATVSPAYQIEADVKTGDFEKKVRNYIARYDSGIKELDEMIRDFLRFLQDKDLYDESEIIITSDHGELMGEENIFFSHGIFCHPALTNVPLIIKKPHQRKGRRLDKNFSLINIVRKIANVPIIKKVYSLHPHSFGVAVGNHYLFFHNASLHHSAVYKECIFPTRNFSLEEILVNLEELKISPTYKIFVKKNNRFDEVHHYTNKGIFLTAFLELEKFTYKIIKDSVRDLYRKIDRLKTEVENKNKTIDSLKAKIKMLEESSLRREARFFGIPKILYKVKQFLKWRKSQLLR